MRSRRLLAQRLCVIIALVIGPFSASAQSTSADAYLRIRVVNDAGQAIVAAEVAVQARRRVEKIARSDSAGVAFFPSLEPGLWNLSVRRIGIKPVSVDVRLKSGSNEFTVVAGESALRLSGIRVVGGMTYSERLDDFERRRASGIPNAVVTREQIEKVGPIAVSRMLRGIGGLRIGDSLGYTVAISTRGAKATRNTKGVGFAMVPCVMRVAVDGTIMPPLFNIDQLVPKDIYGIEVYDGPARMPPEFSGLRLDNWCGLIAMWTRDR